jgi:selenide,water dikinase
MQLADESYRSLMCDPQTSGGLLVAVRKDAEQEVQTLLSAENLWSRPVGVMVEKGEYLVEVL